MKVINESIGFISDEILGMNWLNKLIGKILSMVGVDINTSIGGGLQFFIYDIIKILFLLSFMIFVISYIQSYFPPQRIKKILGKYRGIFANLMGAILGTITPFCSCSSIPLFIGFTNAGLPVGVTFSFLISSPLVDLGAFILISSIFGFKVAFIYVVVGVLLAVIGGVLIDRFGLEKYVEKYIDDSKIKDINGRKFTIRDRVNYSKLQTVTTFKKVFRYVIIGVFVGAFIHNIIPVSFIEKILGKGNIFSVVIATFLGVPMYSDIFAVIPVAEALFNKGVQLGTVLSFMMSVTALSLPSIIMLRKAVKPKLIIIFVGIVTTGIIIIGYVFNMFGGI